MKKSLRSKGKKKPNWCFMTKTCLERIRSYPIASDRFQYSMTIKFYLQMYCAAYFFCIKHAFLLDALY